MPTVAQMAGGIAIQAEAARSQPVEKHITDVGLDTCGDTVGRGGTETTYCRKVCTMRVIRKAGWVRRQMRTVCSSSMPAAVRSNSQQPAAPRGRSLQFTAIRLQLDIEADSALKSSQAINHPNIDKALCCLISEVGRDPVHSTVYCRLRFKHNIISQYRVLP